MDDSTTSFGALLHRMRSKAGLSQEALAERAGLSRNGISNLERGANPAPRLETVHLLADALALGEPDRAALLAAARPTLVERAGSAREPSSAALPVPLTPLIGREAELAALRTMLASDHVHLVTITGPGGVGKTRLAIAVAEQVGEAFPDGRVFVDLAPLRDPALVVSTIAHALGLRERGGPSVQAALAAFLASKRLLLVLDNYEHLLEAAPVVSDLLQAGPRNVVLVTSREPLRLRGEREFALAPLAVPDLHRHASAADLTQNPAVALFVQRAQAARVDFVLTDDNAAAIAAICARLDGLPLAIELAAVRIKMLPPAALLARLRTRLPLLTGGSRDAPARQRTLRDTIAWSHDLLSQEEQTIFRRLAVFSGGCTIEAAETVAGADVRLNVFGTLAALVDASLLRQDEGIAGEPRFRMLETVREYGLEQLEARREAEAIRQRLADWCLALAEQAEPARFWGDISPAGILRLEEELPNLRTAVNWLLARGEATQALRLLVAAEDFWTQRHMSDAELHRWLETALAAAPDAPGRDRVLARFLLSMGHGVLGHDEAALHHAQRLLDIAEASGEAVSLGIAHVRLAGNWEDRGEMARVAAAYAEAIPLLRMADGYDAFALNLQAQLADKLILQGDLGAGIPMLEEALRQLRQRTDPPWNMGHVITLRGYAALRQDDLPLAARLFAESIERASNLRHTQALLGALAGLAGVALARGQAGRAAHVLGAIETTMAPLGFRRLYHWIHVERITADVRAALPPTEFERAWANGRAVPLEEAITEALTIADEVISGANS